MDIKAFIEAMPKVATYVRLEGAIKRETLVQIAEQNEINETLKKYDQWVDLLHEPDFDALDDLLNTTSLWLQYPEDLTRVVYDLGVWLSKQNVKYAEIGLNVALLMENDFTFEQLMAAVNDGRERAERAWDIKLGWYLTIARDKPRTADDIVRWATGNAGRKARIVGICLLGPEDAQPAGQFERAFKMAEKKEAVRLAECGDKLGSEGVQDILSQLPVNRIIGGWGLLDDADLTSDVLVRETALEVCMARALHLRQISDYAEYPLRKLMDTGIPLIIAADMPTYFETSLNQEYLAAVEQGGLTLDELQTLALNAVRACQLAGEAKAEMERAFLNEYARLRDEMQNMDREVS